MANKQRSHGEHPIEISATKARGGVISGRILTVLIVSALLALAAFVALMIAYLPLQPTV